MGNLAAGTRSGTLFLVAGFVLLLTGGTGLAQTTDLPIGLGSAIAVKGKGWMQLQNAEELIEFLLGIVEAGVFTAAIAFHPVVLNHRRTEADFELPRSTFMYGLVGMTIGFLIVHHGYLIGFVVVGIGGLLRFRTDVHSTLGTTCIIVVTLIGLCVGLDLPVMAAFTSIGACAIMFLVGRENYYTVEIKFEGKSNVSEAVEGIRGQLAGKGFEIRSVNKTKFKPTAEFVLTAKHGVTRETLVREMTAMQSEKANKVADWHLE